MNTVSPYAIGAGPMTGVVQNPSTTQDSDTAMAPLAIGHSGALLATQVHGRGYTAASRKNRFVGNGATTTGIEILAPGGTTSGFCFGNPAGSGVYMEVHALRAVPIGATVVVAALGLEFGATPVSTTYQVVNGMPIGASGVPLCKVWDAVTIVANTWLRALPLFYPATTDVDNVGYEWLFDGGLVIAPGYAVNLVSSTTQGTIKFLTDVEWSEWLI